MPGIWEKHENACALTRAENQSFSGNPIFRDPTPSFTWRCLTLRGDAEAVGIAVVVGEEELGLPVVSMLDL